MIEIIEFLIAVLWRIAIVFGVVWGVGAFLKYYVENR